MSIEILHLFKWCRDQGISWILSDDQRNWVVMEFEVGDKTVTLNSPDMERLIPKCIDHKNYILNKLGLLKSGAV